MTETPSSPSHSPHATNANSYEPPTSSMPTSPTAASPPSNKCWTMSAPAASNRFYVRQVSSFNSCSHTFIAPTLQNEQPKLTRIT